MSDNIRISQNDALIVIDVQNDFCPGGALAVPGGDHIIAPINALMPKFQHVFFSQDWHPEGHKSFASAHQGKAVFETAKMSYGTQILWPDHCVQNSEGAAFHADLNTKPAQAIIRKGHNPLIDSYSAFFENDRMTPTGLGGLLKQRRIERIFLTGLAYEYCVGFSALDGASEGFTVFLITDATGGFGNDDTFRMTEQLNNQRIHSIKIRDIA